MLKAVGAVVFAVVAIRGDLPLMLLGGLAAVVLAVLAVRDALSPVRLSADPEGITLIRGFAGRERLTWPEVEQIRLYDTRRLGRRNRMLEIDTGESLRLLSAHDLGAPAEDVERQLRELRSGADHGTPGPAPDPGSEPGPR